MREFLRVLVEESAMGIIEGDLMAWFYLALFTVVSMRLAAKLGKFLSR